MDNYVTKIREERKQKILSFMKEPNYKPLLLDELAGVLAVPLEDTELFRFLLEELEIEGKIYKSNKKRYAVPKSLNLVSGILQGNEQGFAFLLPEEEGAGDIFIPAVNLSGAMHRDRVLARISGSTEPGRRPEGEIVRILSRANVTVTGTMDISGKTGFVVPDDKRISSDIFVPRDEFHGALHGNKVVVKITRYPEARRNAEGTIVEVLGDADEKGVDVLSIIRSYNLRDTFPDSVMKETDKLPSLVEPQMAEGRRDLREVRMVTIDGEDAKDLDDAVSVERMENGNYLLGVHIADVSHYVAESSELDKEALLRGTSVYLVDRVLPMLPQKLSNGICSLNMGVDRLAFSVTMEIDRSGEVKSHDIFESIININERMTYTDVYRILEEENPELSERYGEHVSDFRLMKELAGVLREKRIRRGSIDFDFPETKVTLDEKGKPIEIKRYEITIANRIIEEFMLVCNETVAEHFCWTETPFVYRVHGQPDPEKMETFGEFVRTMGYKFKAAENIHPKQLQDLLGQIKGTAEEPVISMVMLRSLQKAVYSEHNDGHFGLAAKYYCHFTSPIRRYPDLIIHRIMKAVLKGRLSEAEAEELAGKLPEIARHSSKTERDADDAERDTVELKEVEYMRDHIGEAFDGIVSGITQFGMFVELPNTIEGMIRLSDLDDDYYEYEESRFCLRGVRTGKYYRIGQPVRIIVARADLLTRRLDFVLDEAGEGDKGGFEKRGAAAGSRSVSQKSAGLRKSGENKSKRGSQTRKSSGTGKSARGKSSPGTRKSEGERKGAGVRKSSSERKGSGMGKSSADRQGSGTRKSSAERKSLGARKSSGTRKGSGTGKSS